VLLGEIDEEKESQTNLKEVSLEEILEAQSNLEENRVKIARSMVFSRVAKILT
jgi:hypothetical protein